MDSTISGNPHIGIWAEPNIGIRKRFSSVVIPTDILSHVLTLSLAWHSNQTHILKFYLALCGMFFDKPSHHIFSTDSDVRIQTFYLGISILFYFRHSIWHVRHVICCFIWHNSGNGSSPREVHLSRWQNTTLGVWDSPAVNIAPNRCQLASTRCYPTVLLVCV